MDDTKQNAQFPLGAEPESLGQAKSTGADSNTIGKQFNADTFLTACAGDVATLHLALLNLANGHALTSHAVIEMAARCLALGYLAAGGVL